MSTLLTTNVTGTADVMKAMEALADAARGEIIVAALEESAQPIVAAAQANAPERRIRPEIKVLGTAQPSTGLFVTTIGIAKKSRAFHGLWYELGTKLRARKARDARYKKTGPLSGKVLRATAGGSTGIMPAKPFLRPAFDGNRSTVLSRFAEILGARIRGLGV